MVPIYIDTTSLQELALTDAEVRGMLDFVVKDISASFANNWELEANSRLKSARNDYIRNIHVVDEGRAQASVVLLGWLPNAIEQGYPAFDMKIGFMNSSKVKMTKKGNKYFTIPLRFGVPGTIGDSGFSNILPEEVHEIAKQKDVRPIKSQGIRESELPAKFKETVIRKAPVRQESKKFEEYKHKHPIHAGVTRVRDPKTGQNRYVSFRRVSTNSDPNAFIHPGFDALHLAEIALEDMNIPFETGKAVDRYLRNIGFD